MENRRVMVTVNGMKVVFDTSFLAKNDQEVTIEAPFEGQSLRLTIIFKAGPAGEQPTGEWLSENGSIRMTFSGWSNPMGSCLLDPTKFGDVNGKRMFFQFAHYRVGEQNLVHFYILIGD